MKHAYLIIAHNEFEVLQTLIEALDDIRNDIYVHIDKKVNKLPKLTTQYSTLFVLKDRVDVRWGHVSQIACEYELFEDAYNNVEEYERYHLISGTHLPLKTQDEINTFFDKKKKVEILSFIYTNSYEVNYKLGRYHFFAKHYMYGTNKQIKYARLLWQTLLWVQRLLNIQKPNYPQATIKANNWVSLTNNALGYVLSRKKFVMKKFRWSFCGDEYFVPYLLEESKGRFQIANCPELLFNDFEGRSTPRVLNNTDYDFLMQSDYLFARKFSEKEMKVVDKIVDHVIVAQSHTK